MFKLVAPQWMVMPLDIDDKAAADSIRMALGQFFDENQTFT